MRSTTRSVAMLAAASFTLANGPTFAASAAGKLAQGRAAVLQALTDCRKLTDDASRLACYDKAAGVLDQAETTGQVVVIDREQAKAVRRDAFGFNLPSLHLFSRGTMTRDEVVDNVELQVDQSYADANGRFVITTTSGATWRQKDGEPLADNPHKGSTLVVKSGVLGAFFCKVDRQSAVRCQRTG